MSDTRTPAETAAIAAMLDEMHERKAAYGAAMDRIDAMHAAYVAGKRTAAEAPAQPAEITGTFIETRRTRTMTAQERRDRDVAYGIERRHRESTVDVFDQQYR